MPPELHLFSILYTLFLILWTGIAVFGAVKPKTLWRITQGWKAFSEPPAAYFALQRVIASLFAVVGLTLLLLPLFR